MVIQRLILHTALVDELSVFYADVLALPVTKKENGIRILIGKSELLFEVAAKGTSPLYHFAFTIPSNKIEEARTWLLNKVELIWMEDYKSDIAEFVNWHARSVYFFDPAGNIVELIARADLKNESHEPFQSNQILSRVPDQGSCHDRRPFQPLRTFSQCA